MSPTHPEGGPRAGPFWMRRSLWQQLLLPVVSLWAACAVLAAGAAYFLAGQSTHSSFDRLLGDDAYALAAQVRWHAGQASFIASKDVADMLVFDSLSTSRYVVRTDGGDNLAGDMNLNPPPGMDARGKYPVFYDEEREPGLSHRVAAIRLQPDPQDEAVWVMVAESNLKRQQVRDQIATAIFMPAGITGFIIVPMFYFGIRRALQPTRQLSALVAEQGEDNLAPLNEDDVPLELRELVAHTNSLLHRLQSSVDEQRRFIADAAHQLQTPIAGIRVLVGDMRRTQRADPTQPMDATVLTQLDEVATRSARLVKQLLAYARVAEDSTVEDERFDAVGVMLEAAHRWERSAAAAGKVLRIDAPLDAEDMALPFLVRGSPTLLGEAVSNLVDNAIRYGGAQIALDISHTAERLVVRVRDDGDALDEKTRTHLLLPFWRGQHGQPDGSGLGLSIVQRIVARMGGTLELLAPSAEGGTCFEIVLPSAVTIA